MNNVTANGSDGNGGWRQLLWRMDSQEEKWLSKVKGALYILYGVKIEKPDAGGGARTWVS